MTEFSAEPVRLAIVAHTRRLAAAAAAAGPGAGVPTTPKWNVADLVTHVGRVQHWTAEIIERRITDPAQLPTDEAEPPTEPDAWPTWLEESAQRVVTAFSDQALHAPVFNAAGDERSGTQFWMLNVLNETFIHGFDAANAARRSTALDADLAASLITHHLAMLTSPTWEMQVPASAQAIRGTGQTLQWLTTDTSDDGWFIERRTTGATWQPANRAADVTITGPAQSLLLTLTRRLPLTDNNDKISIEGDTALAQYWLDNTAHVAD